MSVCGLDVIYVFHLIKDIFGHGFEHIQEHVFVLVKFRDILKFDLKNDEFFNMTASVEDGSGIVIVYFKNWHLKLIPGWFVNYLILPQVIIR